MPLPPDVSSETAAGQLTDEKPGTLSLVAVIVTFNPDLEILRRLLDACARQADAIVLVDNGDGALLADWLALTPDPKIALLPLGENRGVAAAQNAGIGWARQNRADYVLLLDHDSIPAPDMVAKLLEIARTKRAEGEKIAAVGPRYYDPRREIRPPFIRIEGLHLRRCDCGPGLPAVAAVDYLMSSGSVIPMATLAGVGGMEEKLFIDYVDIEWGLRAKKAGYQCYGVCDAAMEHSLGDRPLRFLGRQFPLHSPLRHYYMVRNGVWMCRQPWVPGNWKLVEGSRLVLRVGCYALLARPRAKHIAMMLRGLWHGLVGRMGRL